MADKSTEKKKVLLLGDPTIDIYMLRNAPMSGGGDAGMDWQKHTQWRSWKMDGGIHLIKDFMIELGLDVACIAPEHLNDDAKSRMASLAHLEFVKKNKDGNLEMTAGNPFLKKTTACPPPDEESEVAPKDQQFARVVSFEGYQELVSDPKTGCSHGYDLNSSSLGGKQDGFNPDVVAISDAGSGLRGHPQLLDDPRLDKNRLAGKPVVLKMHLPLAHGEVWEWFRKQDQSQRIVIVGADDLRASGVGVNRCLSWDSVVMDLKRALQPDNILTKLLLPDSRLVILFDVEGAVIIRRKPGQGAGVGNDELDLVCHPSLAEGGIDELNYGDLVGKMSAFLTHFVHDIALPAKESEQRSAVVDLVSGALDAERCFAEKAMVLEGHESASGLSNLFSLTYPPLDTRTGKNGAHKRDEKKRLIKIEEIEGMKGTSLLGHLLGHAEIEVDQLAREIVEQGHSMLNSYPKGTFGELVTLDHHEIEGYRAIKRLLKSYFASNNETKPISLAVFGSPGSGKSFGVKKLVDRNVTPILEFNLSQAMPSDLPGFFHEIRDYVLRGKTPLCFFDEFDSNDRSLIAHFLAPMQDGEFRDGPRVHPIGKAVFVFAGGTAESYSDLTDPDSYNTPDKKDGDVRLRALKIPDFASRLRGHINIQGINKTSPEAEKSSSAEAVTAELGPVDEFYKLRRALILRAQLEQHMPGIFTLTADNGKGQASIDPPILSLLLKDADYVHGARSMEQIVRMSSRGPAVRHFSYSDLPLKTQQEMHINVSSGTDT